MDDTIPINWNFESVQTFGTDSAQFSFPGTNKKIAIDFQMENSMPIISVWKSDGFGDNVHLQVLDAAKNEIRLVIKEKE